MRILSILLFLAGSVLGQSAANKATVVPETLALHEEMSPDSAIVAELHKGDEVTIRSSMAQSGETWCSISQAGEDGKSGSVPCASLKREPRTSAATHTPPVSHAAPLLPTSRAAHIPKAARSTIYLVPLGGFRFVDLNTLVEYYQQKFGLQVRILPAIPFNAASYDPARKQYIAERLMELLVRSLPNEARNPSTLVIGITEGDIYITSEKSWLWALGLRASPGWGVISAARMDLNHFAYNRPVDSNILHRNLAKMTSRYIGFLYYGLDISPNPRSVVRQEMYGIDDLEFVSEEF